MKNGLFQRIHGKENYYHFPFSSNRFDFLMEQNNDKYLFRYGLPIQKR